VHGVVVTVQRQADLLEVVGALPACGRVAHLLHGGQKKTNQDPNDGDHHQQLDQREAAAPGTMRHVRLPSVILRMTATTLYRCLWGSSRKEVWEREEKRERRGAADSAWRPR